MTLTLLLPWFPILLAVGLGARLLGRTRGFALGLLGGLFWVALLQASAGRALWSNLWTVATIITGTVAILAVGGWSGEGADELGAPKSRSTGTTSIGDQAGRCFDRLAAALDEFDDWLTNHRNDANPWPKFDELVRTVTYQCVQATHVRPYRLLPEGDSLMPLSESDPLVESKPISAKLGTIGEVIATGRSHLADLAGSDTAWCFAVTHGNERVGVVSVGRLGICPHANLEMLRVLERLIVRFWCTLREVCQARSAVLIDPVSGLLTRETLLRIGQESLEDSRRLEEPAAVAAIALEGLRELNDVGRWEQADELIGAVGRALRQKARTDDRLGRFDGSRFLVLLRRVDSELANLIVAQMLARLKAISGDRTRWNASVGIRCGLAIMDPRQPDLRQLVSRAVAQCHRARALGIPIAAESSNPRAGPPQSESQGASPETRAEGKIETKVER